MRAKPLTLSVIVTTLVAAASLVSQQIDKQDAPLPRHVAAPPASSQPPSMASPLDIDPRRMAAPAAANTGAEIAAATPSVETARTRLSSSSD